MNARLLCTGLSLAAMLTLPSQSKAQVPATPAPADLPGLRYTNDFFPGTTYKTAVPPPQSVLGFPLAQRATSAAEVERCLKAWTAAAPDRTRLVEYARTHEGRPLHYVVITAPANLARLDEIQQGLARLGDPRKLAEADAQRLIQSLPAVAWLAYNIHGDETEGSDAALAMLYHLIAAEGVAAEKLLADLVIIIDPLMNPDGRDRFLKMVAEHRGTMPNVDDQSLLHEGYWPRGRGNHYLFDLNRDWILGTQPETRGRIREVGRWNPVLFVDAHGMGAQETHLFSPPREPINPNIPAERERWGQVFAQDQARAFDRQGLVYYTGEWHEEWFPGYSDGWVSYRGAIGILYEQARIAEDGVRRPGGRILSYRESVRHHVIGSTANLLTAQSNAKKLLEHLYSTRKAAVAPDGPYAKRTFAILPTRNGSRLRQFVDLMRLEGFELFQSGRATSVPVATDQLGRELKDVKLPEGTVLIPNRQPLANLLAAMLEFDPHLSAQVLADERKEILGKGTTRIYDTTAWNLTQLFGLEALTIPTELPDGAKPLPASTASLAGGPRPDGQTVVGYVIDGADDAAVAAAARLMERGVQVRLADKPFRFDERDFARGSIVVTQLDNREAGSKLGSQVSDALKELGVEAVAVSTGLGLGELPDLGGGHFRRLEAPRIALVGREMASSGDYGSIWFVLDHHLGIRQSQLDDISGTDLSRYNVIVLPDRGGAPMTPERVVSLKDWVKAGGTLVAIAGSAGSFTSEKAEFGKVRPLPDVLTKLGDYELAIFREWMAKTAAVPGPDRVWSHQPAADLQYPWQAIDGAHPDEKELKRRDAWQALFMPQGALLAGRVDTNHWLTAGCGEWLPVLVGRQPVLMTAGDGVETAIRYGFLAPTSKPLTEKPPATEALGASTTGASAGEKKPDEGKAKKEPPRIGWCAVPKDAELHLRMSGLLWPEAAHRLANAAWATREPIGRGQIILFATPPTFRAATRGTMRVFLNALVCGPGLGATQPVRP